MAGGPEFRDVGCAMSYEWVGPAITRTNSQRAAPQRGRNAASCNRASVWRAHISKEERMGIGAQVAALRKTSRRE